MRTECAPGTVPTSMPSSGRVTGDTYAALIQTGESFRVLFASLETR